MFAVSLMAERPARRKMAIAACRLGEGSYDVTPGRPAIKYADVQCHMLVVLSNTRMFKNAVPKAGTHSSTLRILIEPNVAFSNKPNLFH